MKSQGQRLQYVLPVALLLLAACGPQPGPGTEDEADWGSESGLVGEGKPDTAQVSAELKLSKRPRPGPVDAGSADAGATDAGTTDAGTSPDAGSVDAGTGSDAGSVDAGEPDAGTSPDAGSVDAGEPDAGTSPDAGSVDAGEPDAGTSPDAGQPDEGVVSCPPLELQGSVVLDGFVSNRYVWRDRACKPRSAVMVHNDRVDPMGWYGGYMRRYTYEVDGATRTCDGAHQRHPGWGYTVNHYGNTSRDSLEFPGTYRTVLQGRHHAIHEYRWRLDLGGHAVWATVHWLFATGRDHPVWAVTFDSSALAPNALSADTRAPYGDLLYDGNAYTEVSGVGWGDRYRFVSLQSPLTEQSGWDYSVPNSVPYVLSWTNLPDAEMGSVQTQTWRQHDAGGNWLYSYWGQRSSSGPMPTDWQWTFQLNQYELPYTTHSHRLAWGTNYGAVGQTQYWAYGDDRTLSGYPYQSYSVFVVLGRHSTNTVLSQVGQVEAYQQVRLTATVGQVLTSGPAGVGRSDTAPYAPAGYNHLYATWELQASGNRAQVRLEPGSLAVDSPMLVVRGYTAAAPPAHVWLDGVQLVPDVDYFASVDTVNGALWLTLARTLRSATTLTLE